MGYYPASINRLINNFAKLPGVGAKTAERLAMYILTMPHNQVSLFAESLLDVKQKVRFCSKCFCISDGEICLICSDSSRDSSLLCVVEQQRDMIVIEKSDSFKGLYHILGGVLSPIDGIYPQDIRIKELYERIDAVDIKEVVIATGTNAEGESTASYISKMLLESKTNVKVSRIASGVPVGGELQYVDQVTMKKAMDTRYAIK